MNAHTDFTAEFSASDDFGPMPQPVLGRNWVANASVPKKFALIYAAQLVVAVLFGFLAWRGLVSIQTSIAEVSPELQVRLDELLDSAKWWAMVLFSLAVVTGVGGFYRLTSDISATLTRLTRVTQEIADGNLDVEVPATDRADEFGAMARSIELLRRNSLQLRRFQAAERARSEAELAEREHNVAEREAQRDEQQRVIGGIADKFDRSVGEIVTSVAAAASELQATATAMAANADQSSNQSERASEALVEATAGVTAAAAASEEFALSIGEISRQASTSAELARKANGAALDADKTISALTDSAAEIGKVVELISHIAQRTNLLALNASIEAARGGEAGRGFAVVASEVKELATQTGKATEQVAAQIRAMQETTGASVGALKDIGQQIKQLESTAISIAAAVDQQSKAGQDLARSIDLAARGAEEVTSNIAQVRAASRSTGNVASQVLSSATELESQATHLSTMAGDFISQVRQS
ncbi:MAG: HAMP domain-containing protein [Erythrobacter sp.]|nr:HAMP domain-containing protein [Erythrobacter sp.]